MPPGRERGDASTRRALQIALLDEIGLEHILDGVGFLADGSRQVVQPDRAATEFFHHRQQQLAVHHVQSDGIDIQHAQRGIGDIA